MLLGALCQKKKKKNTLNPSTTEKSYHVHETAATIFCGQENFLYIASTVTFHSNIFQPTLCVCVNMANFMKMFMYIFSLSQFPAFSPPSGSFIENFCSAFKVINRWKQIKLFVVDTQKCCGFNLLLKIFENFGAAGLIWIFSQFQIKVQTKFRLWILAKYGWQQLKRHKLKNFPKWLRR